MKKKIDTWNK